MPTLHAGPLLLAGTFALTLLWWGQLLRFRPSLIPTTSVRSWLLGFLLPVPFFALPISLARLGLLSDFSRRPPPFFLFVLFLFVLCYSVAKAPIVLAVARRLGVSGLILFQSFRVLPEMVIAAGVAQGVAPVQLSYQGYNMDLIYAVFAGVLGVMMKLRPQTFQTYRWAMTAHILGCLSLLNILIIAITSMPTPLQMFPESQSNEWVTFEPYVLLPGFMVSSAVIGHFLLHQILRQEKS